MTKERERTEAEQLQDQAKNILDGIGPYKDSKHFSAILQAAKSLVLNLGMIVIDEIAPELKEDEL